MEKFKTLADGVALAEYAHRNQLDKAGFPYVDHPKRVMQSVQSMGVAPYVQIAAVLHDVPEDTAFSHDIIESLGFSEAVTRLTRLLDRDYSERLFRLVSGPNVQVTKDLTFNGPYEAFDYQRSISAGSQTFRVNE